MALSHASIHKVAQPASEDKRPQPRCHGATARRDRQCSARLAAAASDRLQHARLPSTRSRDRKPTSAPRPCAECAWPVSAAVHRPRPILPNVCRCLRVRARQAAARTATCRPPLRQGALEAAGMCFSYSLATPCVAPHCRDCAVQVPAPATSTGIAALDASSRSDYVRVAATRVAPASLAPLTVGHTAPSFEQALLLSS